MKKNNLKLQYFISDFNENLAGGNDPLTPSFDVTENYYLEKNKFLENATGNKVMERVNIKTGKAYVSQFVYGVNGNRLPFNLSLTYNPYFYDKTEIFDDLTTNGKSGFLPAKGWKFNYQQYLRKQDNYYYYYDQNFELHKFAPALGDSSIYYDSTGQTGLTLKEVLTDGSITAYEITDGKNTTLTFNAQGALVNITEKRGTNAINLTITYNENSTRITSITDGANRTFNFVYDDTAKTITLTRLTSAEESTEQLAVLKLNDANRFEEVYYSKQNTSVTVEYDYLNRLLNIENHGEMQLTAFNYTTESLILSLANYKLQSVDNSQQNVVYFIYDGNKTTVRNTVNKANEEGTFINVNDIKHYYFANNGELIYVVRNDAPPMGGTAFLDANTFATAKDFKEYGEALSSIPTIKFAFDNGENEYVTKINLPNNTPTLSESIENVKISNNTEFFLMVKSTKTSDSAQTGAVTVNLRNNNANMNQDVTFSGDDLPIKFKKFTLLSGSYTLSVRATNQDSEAIDVEVWLCAHYGSNTKEVITKDTGNPALLQCLQGGYNYWYEMKKCNITSGTQTVENVEYTFRDNLLTRISYFKNPSSFNVWYNDGKNMFANCSFEELRFNFNPESGSSTWHNLVSFNYAIREEGINAIKHDSFVFNTNYIIKKTETESAGIFQIVEEKLNEYFCCLTQTDEHDIVTEYTYNSYGECTQQKVYPSSDSAMNILTTTGYNAKGEVVSESSYKNLKTYTTRYTYNEDGDIVTVTTPNGQVITDSYNGNNQLISTQATVNSALNKNNLNYYNNLLLNCDANSGNYFEFAYDKFNNVTSVKQGSNTIYSQNTYYNNDKSGYTEITYGNGYVERRYFDKYGHVNRITEVVNGTETELYILIYGDLSSPQESLNCIASIYDLDNTFGIQLSKNSVLLKIIDKRTEFYYNDRYNCWIYYYDAAGNLIHIKENKFGENSYNVKTASKDEFCRITQKDIFVGEDEDLSTYFTKTKNIQYASNLDNEIISETAETGIGSNVYLGVTSSYSRDLLLRPVSTTVTDSSGVGYKQEFTYEARQHEETKTVPGPSLDGIIMPPRVVKYTVDDGTTNYIASVKTYAVNGETQTLEKTEVVDYNTNGNITKFGNNTYVYDGINRLTRENNADLNKSFTYAYDTRGNITQKREYAYTTGTLGTATATKNFTYDNNNRLTSDSSNSYSYDNLGNPTYYKGATFTWKGNKLTAVTKNAKTYELEYDCNGLLHCKNYVNDSSKIKEYFYYDGDKLIYDLIYRDGVHYPDSLSYTYNKQGVTGFYFHDVYGDNGGANGGNYTFRKNLFGDITEIYQGATCVAKYKYDAWGNCTVCNPDGTVNTSETFIGNINPFRYRGYYWDNDLQLYYLQTRYYDPTVCRFISPDSHEYLDPETFGGLNLYAYCYNNPISYADPSGNLPFFILTAIIGAIIGVGITALVDYIPDKEFDLHWGWYVGAGLLGAAIGAGIGMAISYYATGSIASSTGKVFSGLFGKTTLYRSVGADELADIKKTGKFNLKNGSMETKQFGLSLDETKIFGNWANQSNIVSAKIPNRIFYRLDPTKVDPFIFKSGVVTVTASMLNSFNNNLLDIIFL